MFLLRRIISPATYLAFYSISLWVKSEILKTNIFPRFSRKAQNYFWLLFELEWRGKTEVWNTGDVGALCFNICQVVFMFSVGSSTLKKAAGANTYCSCIEHLSVVLSHYVTMWGNELSFSGSLNKWVLIEPDVFKMLQCFLFLSQYTHTRARTQRHGYARTGIHIQLEFCKIIRLTPTGHGWKQSGKE